MPVPPSERPQFDERAELDRNHARLAAAAHMLLADAPRHPVSFGAAEARAIEQQGYPDISSMIHFGMFLNEQGQGAIRAEIEDATGIAVRLVDFDMISEDATGEGYLVGLMGTDILPQNGVPFIRGVASTWTTDGEEEFPQVGVLPNGFVFLNPPEPSI